MPVPTHTPIRIQRKRERGWRLPPNTICVTRPGPFSNPYKIGDRFPEHLSIYKWYGTGEITRDNCLLAFASYAEDRLLKEPEWLDPLLESDIACWCKVDEPCHGDIILELLDRRRKSFLTLAYGKHVISQGTRP